ncbi:hypothetical protein [Vibrio caribbeanicus]|uniref:hypothetical protein n=1 Tax=Vibrio caribbeanicus TaxID=701175 RepID=UPI0030D9B358
MNVKMKSSKLLFIFLFISFFSQQTQIVPIHFQYVTIFFIAASILHSNKLFRVNHDAYIIFFLVVTSFSVFISLDKTLSLVRFVTLSTVVVFLFYIVDFKRENIDRLLLILFFASSVYTFISFLNIDQLKDYKGEFEGYIGNRYNISALLGVYFILSFALVIEVKRFGLTLLFIFISLIGLYLIYQSYSRVGFFYIGLYGLCVASIFFIRLGTFTRVLLSFFVVCLTPFAIIYLVSNDYAAYVNDYAVYAIERGMTGRDVIANVLLEHMQNNMYSVFLGFGPGSLESIAPGILHRASPRDVNNIVGVIFEYGVLGLLAFLALFLRYFYQLYRLSTVEGVSYAYLCIPIPIMLSVSEVSWLNFNTFPTLIMFLFMSYTSHVYASTRLNNQKFNSAL